MHDRGACHKLFRRLSELLDGELDRVTAGRIEAHLADCPECLACWATFKKSVALYQALESGPMPPGFVEDLKAFLRRIDR
ncbi:MAG: zf-HC2 domain-containing protein [Thermodesulfobacteriota bacterium]